MAGYKMKPLCAWILTLFAIAMMFPFSGAAATDSIQTRPDILFISAYAYDWEAVPYQLNGFNKAIAGQADMEYTFMNTKKFAYEDIRQEFAEHIENLIARNGQYDLVVAADDAALDFVLEYRNQLFENIPVVFMGVNTAQRGIQAHKDPLITGMIECFPYNETIALATQLYPKATKIVGIGDDTVSGRGCAARFFDEAPNFTQLEFSEINASQLSRAELQQQISALDDSCILVFLALVNDGDGNLYSLQEATQFVEENAAIPMFKADMVGIGMGVLGGYVSSYEDMGKAAGEQALQVLHGTSPADIPVNTMGGYPLFDQNMLDKYGISGKYLPANSVILNKRVSFFEQYHTELLTLAVGILLLMIAIVAAVASSRQKMNYRLKVAVEEAEAATKEKTAFLARMSHDMRTPMNTIINLTRMVEGELDKPEVAMTDLKHIETSNQFLLGLIEDILDMSRIESGKMVLHPERYSYRDFLNYMTTSFMPLAKERGIELTITPGTAYLDIIIDKVRFNQMCFNLVSNALKYTEPGGHVQFLMKHGEARDGLLPCTIVGTDDGIGISKEFQETMFQAFTQEGRSYRTVEGAGLGLSIVKNIVDIMDGTISVQSELGKGSTFTVKLTMQLANAQEAPTEKKPDLACLQGKHILIVDDHTMNQKIGVRLLESKGMTAELANDGQQAVELFTAKADAFDAILMDLRMPVMDGLAATRAIRALGTAKAKTVPIIAMTANTFDSDIADCKEAGMNSHLSKPIDPDKLYAALAQALTQEVAKA